MRIGIITGEYPPMQGGIGDYSRLLALHLTARNAEVVILTTVRGQARDLVDVHPVVSHWDGRSWLQARSWAAAHHFDIISLQYQTAAFGMSPWIHFLPDILHKTPFVTTFHDLRFPYLFPKADGLRSWIVRHLAYQSSAVIFTNEEDAAQFPRLHPAASIPIGSNITPYSYEPTALSAERDRWGQPNELLIGYFGLLNRTKGVHCLIDALLQVRERGIGAKLLIIGGTTGASDPTNADYALELKHRIAQANLTDAVCYTGYLDDANTALALSACDIIALPYTDGASVRRGSLMAALALGCAIISTTPQHADQYITANTMLLVPPDDSAALAHAIITLHNDPTMQGALRRAAKETAQNFSWEHVAKSHLAFFQQVIESTT